MAATSVLCKFLTEFARRNYVRTVCSRGLHVDKKRHCSKEQRDADENRSSEKTEAEIRKEMLDASLQFAISHGWTQKALSEGATSLGMPSVAHGMFPRGGAELVEYFYMTCNDELSNTLAAEVDAANEDPDLKKKTGAFIRDALEARLRMVIPFLDSWPQAMGVMALPQNAPTAWSNLLNLADTVWYHAGDRSTDFDWYSKRLSLAAIYKSSEFYLIQDRSEDFSDTWGFLGRRLHNATSVGKSFAKLKQTTDVAFEGLYGTFHVIRNMAGMNAAR